MQKCLFVFLWLIFQITVSSSLPDLPVHRLITWRQQPEPTFNSSSILHRRDVSGSIIWNYLSLNDKSTPILCVFFFFFKFWHINIELYCCSPAVNAALIFHHPGWCGAFQTLPTIFQAQLFGYSTGLWVSECLLSICVRGASVIKCWMALILCQWWVYSGRL